MQGFIDFGIVGSLAPASWQAIQALASSAAVSDFETIARALATVGATRTDIDTQVMTTRTCGPPKRDGEWSAHMCFECAR